MRAAVMRFSFRSKDRLVCDSWLKLELPMPDSGQILLMKATKLREKWDTLLSQRLQEATPSIASKNDTTQIEHELNQELIQFMHTTVPYTIKRLLPADLKIIYVGSGENYTEVTPNPFQKDFECKRNEVKGGVRLSNNITFNCLVESEWSDKLAVDMMETEWHCSNCGFEMVMTSIEKLQHQSTCVKAISTAQSDTQTSRELIIEQKTNSLAYDCPECKKTVYLTPIEILRHKRSHL